MQPMLHTPSATPLLHLPPLAPLRRPLPSRAPQSHPPFLSLYRLRHSVPSHLLTAVFSEVVVESDDVIVEEGGFIEIGYISSVHGLQGEVRVKSMTDFQELRFLQPGKRWLRQNFGGKESVRVVELVGGRGQVGQKSWILRFDGIDTVDEAKLLIGSSLLVREEDRPELEDGEFYTRDLIGMKVILKETGDFVGTVVNIFENAANDLLQVRLNTSDGVVDEAENGALDTGSFGPLVWIPFVEAIVPDVDLHERVMKITPPKGLLELNVRPDGMSKKEKKQLEWKERKKFQRRLITAKKQLVQLEQQHVFDGFRHGEKDQRDKLADGIIGLNTKLLQQAMHTINEPGSSKSLGLSEFIRDNAASLTKNTISIAADNLDVSETEKQMCDSLLESGTQLVSKGKVAMVLVVGEYTIEGMGFKPASAASPGAEDTSFSVLNSLLLDDQRFLKLEDRAAVPLIIICPGSELKSIQELFSKHDYFNFDHDKVQFLEEEKLPVIGPATELACKHKILMKSPWEFHQSPVGSGGVLSLLANNILESFSELGVEYVEVLSVNERYIGRHKELCGFVSSQKGHIGMQLSDDRISSEEAYDILFSLEYLKKLTKQMNKLHFYTIPATAAYVEKVDNEWIEINPPAPNAYEIYSSIYSFLSICSVGEVCIMEITE